MKKKNYFFKTFTRISPLNRLKNSKIFLKMIELLEDLIVHLCAILEFQTYLLFLPLYYRLAIKNILL